MRPEAIRHLEIYRRPIWGCRCTEDSVKGMETEGTKTESIWEFLLDEVKPSDHLPWWEWCAQKDLMEEQMILNYSDGYGA